MNPEELKIQIYNALKIHMSPKQIEFVLPYFIERKLKMHIKTEKNSYKGLCRMPLNASDYYKITVCRTDNEDLFFLVFLHEVAHMEVNIKYGRKVLAHGMEWSNTFRALIIQSIKNSCFNDYSAKVLTDFLSKGVLITTAKMHKIEALIENNSNPDIIRVLQVPENALFILQGGKIFKKCERIKTRYRCIDVKTGKAYRVHPNAPVLSWKFPEN